VRVEEKKKKKCDVKVVSIFAFLSAFCGLFICCYDDNVYDYNYELSA
jgi:hypothetical protein